MRIVVGVKFRENGKVYYYDSVNNKLNVGDYVLVETLMGLEFAIVAVANKEINDEKIEFELKSIVRVASNYDKFIADENEKEAKKAFNICKDKINDYGLQMNLIEARYLFDKSKLIFSFTAEERVDFRDLVKDLGATFKTRIELRQISVRDQLRQTFGCCGVCGRELCCQSFLNDFDVVSVKMIKDQNLSLNMSKVTGNCGKLMCCLRYEQNVYEYKAKKLPKVGTKVVASDEGEGIVDSVEYLREAIRVKFRDNEGNYYFKKFKADEVNVCDK